MAKLLTAKRKLLLTRQSELSYGFAIPFFDAEQRIVSNIGIYWFPKSLTNIEATTTKFFKDTLYEVTAPEWVFNKQRIEDYEIVEMPIRGSK